MGNTASQGTPRYDRLRFVLGHGDPAEGRIARDSLHGRGIRRVADCGGSADRLFNALDADIVDLLVYDFDVLRDRFVDAMQLVRRKTRGRNPFVIIVTTIDDTDAETMRRVLRSGVDALIRKPVTGQRLLESVDNLMQWRKPFMVGHDYIGPSHRVDGKPERSDPNLLLPVPNTMRSRAIEGVSEEELERIVEAAVASLRDKQLLACGAEIDLLARQLADGYAVAKGTTGRGDAVRKTLGRLEQVAEDLRARCRGTEFERIGDLAKMLLALTQRLSRGSVGQAPIEVQLLAKLAEAIRRALAVERDSIGVMTDIATTIAKYTGEKPH